MEPDKVASELGHRYFGLLLLLMNRANTMFFYRVTYHSKTPDGRARSKAFKKLGLGEYAETCKEVPLDLALHIKVNRNMSKAEYDGLRRDLKGFVELPPYQT